MNTPDQWARLFKLHHCIGNRKFSAQIKEVQADAQKDLRQKFHDEIMGMYGDAVQYPQLELPPMQFERLQRLVKLLK